MSKNVVHPLYAAYNNDKGGGSAADRHALKGMTKVGVESGWNGVVTPYLPVPKLRKVATLEEFWLTYYYYELLD